MLVCRVLATLALLTLLAPPTPDAPKHAAVTPAQARELADRISLAVERLRGLTFKNPVAVKIVDDAEARKHFRARLDKFWPTAEVALQQKAYIQLGLLPAGTDIMSLLLDLLEEQAGGYYDPSTQTFFLLADMPPSAAPVLMAHELTHALDDQHFGLDPRLSAASKDDDRGTAMGAVVEGSGNLVMTAYMIRELEAGRLSRKALIELAESEAGKATRLKAAPPLLERMLMAPYLLGPTFLDRGNTRRVATGELSPRDLDRAITHPPVSTEQILHPEKYWDRMRRDEPRRVTLPDLAATVGPDTKLRLTGALGELTLAVLTGAGAVDPSSPGASSPASWTNAAAAGWGGDQLQLYEGEKGAATVLATAWDTPNDAREFQSAVAGPGRTVLARNDVVVVVAADAGIDAKALAKAALDGVDAGATDDRR
jgi:hypothetical protein